MRKTCTAGAITEFQFDRPVLAYRIKNFTDGAVYHTHKDVFVLDEASKVMSSFGEDVGIMEFISALKVQVRADVSGEVEVQPTKY